MKRTAQMIEESKEVKAPESSQGNREKKGIGRGNHPNSKAQASKNKKQFKKGVSGNPGGLPGTDLAALYARRFFEGKPLPEHLVEGLKGFNAYGFGVLADRGYGKLKEKTEIQITGGLAVRIEEARRRAKK